MNHCPETERIEPWLDGELTVAAAAALERHLAGCPVCAAERASLAALFASLRRDRLTDPGPALTERILDRVAPSRIRSRQATLVGWSYTAVSAVTTFAFISWIVRPETHVWLGRLVSAAYRSLIDAGLFGLASVAMVARQANEALGFLAVVSGWLGTVVRALGLLAADPLVASALWGAVAASVLTLWWLRPRHEQITRGNRHVGILAL